MTMATTLQESAVPERDDHVTPEWLIELLENELGKFDLDPCGHPKHVHERIGQTYLLDRGENGLELPWAGNVYVNPPYGRKIGAWLEKSYHESLEGRVNLIALLLPARTDTQWWTVCQEAQEWIFLTGRVRFIDPDTGEVQGSPKFPSAVVVFRRGERLHGGPVLSMLDIREYQSLANKGEANA
jgi:phage N-6-adenine-methyltransferase